MRPLRLLCLFVILSSLLVLAQSSHAPLRNQPYGTATTQQRHPALPPNLSQMPQGAPFAQRGARAFKEPAIRRGNSSSGLNFAPAVAYDSGTQPFSVAMADVNGDGKPDLLVANSFACEGCNNGSVSVLLGIGDGTFQNPVTYGSRGYLTFSVAVADVNGDGKPDLLVTNRNNGSVGSVGVLLGNGDGTFRGAVTDGSGGYQANSVAVADVNGDGKPDLLVANLCAESTCAMNGTVGVLLGNGDGTFQTAVPYGSGGYYADSVAVADVNGDGKLDLLVANACASSSNCANGGSVGVLLGNGDGTFQAAVTYGSGGEANLVAVADVNGDGKPDLLLANINNTVGVLLGNGDGTFRTVVTYDTGGMIPLGWW